MQTSRASSTALVLGAGLMGRLLAWQLARRGWRVTVHDAAAADATANLGGVAPGAAARVAAAMLAPLAESAITERNVVEMGRYALTRWPQLLAQLAQPVFFQQEGTLILWHRQDAAEARRFAELLRATGERVPQLPRMQALDAAGVHALEPGLEQRFAQGLYLPGEGQLDNRQLLAALLHELHALSVTLHWNSPRGPQDLSRPEDGPVDWVFDCRGLGARAQMQTLSGSGRSTHAALRGDGNSTHAAVRGVRGEVARVHAPEVKLTRPTRLIHPRYPIYIAPKQDNLYVIGATEIESDDMSPPSVRSTLELLSAAYAVHPGFGEGRIIEIAAHCRPALPDNLPEIRVTRGPGAPVMRINGLYRHGFMISPALLDAVLEIVEHGRHSLAEQLELRIAA
ncbi:glycine oxidase [Hylemonella gracilis str. Niagara R]|uniref:D-amino-acid oxidase n=1 Tax=Hylemonella gracilis str. Niagara R TaxID=1458275 RepID=A0A016XKB9_9BURK|nr:FAD-dependent oxidoreductase [Hylemonella gracilis]EYC51648.1 glycine oxidase [Hylemonella gracilis str. Niagara R]